MPKKPQTPQQPQPSGRGNRIVPILILYTAFLLIWFQFLAPKQQTEPGDTRPMLEQAEALWDQGREPGPDVSRAEQIKLLEQASKRYEQYYNQHRRSLTPEAIQARFQQINIFDYLSTEVEPAATRWYDRAEPVLKDMEKAFHGREGSVTLLVNAREATRSGDLGQIASDRLNDIRRDRDTRNRDKITYRILDTVVGFTGRTPISYFLALLLIVVLLKTVTFPFQKKQYQYQRDMMRISPIIKEAQERMKAEGVPPDEMNRRIFQVYKDNDVNMAAGCLPMLVLMLVLFPVFWMIRAYEYQFTYGTFLWIGSEFATRSPWLANNLAQFDVPLFILYLLTTVAFSLMQPKPADPQQAQTQRMMMIMMPVMFGVFMWMWQWSSAFMLYWLVLNLVSMYQTWLLRRRFGLGGAPETGGGGAGPSGGGGGGGGSNPPPAPVRPLTPMKGVHTETLEERRKKSPRRRRMPTNPRTGSR
jgi:YidC/Oxa1 family membrane protein insertase